MNDFEKFHRWAADMQPFDVQGNPHGFAFAPYGRGRWSCQAAHMPLLEYLASKVGTVTEFGCREGYSTAAILKGLARSSATPKLMTTVDRDANAPAVNFSRWELPAPWRFIQRDIVSGDWAIDECDWLHVDDLHTYGQVKRELDIHGGKVSKLLSFHDTYSQGTVSLDVEGQEGINRAIEEYCAANGWRLCYDAKFNHGLRVYEK